MELMIIKVSELSVGDIIVDILDIDMEMIEEIHSPEASRGPEETGIIKEYRLLRFKDAEYKAVRRREVISLHNNKKSGKTSVEIRECLTNEEDIVLAPSEATLSIQKESRQETSNKKHKKGNLRG